MSEFDITGKYPVIHRKGIEAVKRGNPKEFSGVDPDLRNRFNLALRFTPDTQVMFDERVVRPILNIADRLGIKMVAAGREYPVHSTVLEGIFTGKEEVRDGVYNSLSNNLEVADVRRILGGADVSYQYLIADGANVLLTATEQASVNTLRDRLSTVYVQAGLEPLIGIKALLHISTVRITTPFTEISTEARAEYINSLRKLRRGVKRDPIKLVVADVSAMSAYELLTGDK